MKTVPMIVNENDVRRLLRHMERAAHDPRAERLANRLNQARVVLPSHVPPDVVTMNSRLVIRYPDDTDEDRFLLSYPDVNADGALSVFSPLGTAVFGAREGETVRFMGAKLPQTVRIESIEYQPERAGELDL